METYGKILLIAMPAFLVLVLFEKWYGWRKGNDTVRNLDMISSLSSGVTNVTKDVIGLYFIVLSYPFFPGFWPLPIFPIRSSYMLLHSLHWTLRATGYTGCSM
ncbi:MAG: hypothetical protein ACXWWA_11635 [Chitinophagaceae bacterium]